MINNIRPSELSRVGASISRTIDFATSRARTRAEVANGVSIELDNLRRKQDGVESLLTRVSTELVQRAPPGVRMHIRSCIFFPQLGFLVQITVDPTTTKGRYESCGHTGLAWKHAFSTSEHAYYKTTELAELDKLFGDYLGDISRKFGFEHAGQCHLIRSGKQIEILHGLASSVLQREHYLVAASDAFGELDSLIALALGAEKYQWTAPTLTDENIIDIRGGRHPLQELVVPSYIPNDCHLAGRLTGGACGSHLVHTIEDRESPSMLVVTGPNHSGKSVYLKQVALIVFLAHIGSFVPAEHAIIGLTDKILTRISTRESMSRNESAFAIDLKQVAFATKFATRRSLVLVDEFGKGTRPDDGAGLMAAFLDHFSSLGPEQPRAVAATHFHEVIGHGQLQMRGALAFAHMEVLIDHKQAGAEDQVTYLYKLVPGVNTSSFGSRCAALNRVDPEVVDRSEAISLLLSRGEDLGAACAKLTTEEEVRLELAERTGREFVQLEFGDLSRAARGVARTEVGVVDSVRAVLDRVLRQGN